MTEAAKTSIFIGVGVLVAVFAFAASREPDEAAPERESITKIEKPGDVASLQVVSFNDTKGEVDDFKVVYQGDRYVISTKNDYPADAAEQLLDAASSVMDIDVINVEESDKSLHAERGLIDPRDPSVGEDTAADTVGTRITMTDGEEKTVADFIFGREVEDRDNVRFVRRAGQDQVYTVELDAAPLSTDFAKWIEKDLLRLDPLDVRAISLLDQSVELQRRGFRVAAILNERARVELKYDPQELEWALDDLVSFDQVDGQAVSMELADDQELDSTKLNGLKNALDDLKIVDVWKKPTGLADERFLEQSDPAALQDLSSKGYYFDPSKREIVSDQGEVRVDMADGVRYVLRFGRIEGSEAKEVEGAAVGTEEQDIRRYLWVVAKENLGIFPRPDLKPLPEKPTAPPEFKKEGASKEEIAVAEGRQKEYERLKAEYDKVEQNNDRKESEYEAKIRGAKKAVAKLNRRFKDWYYVIDNDTYKQIHLGRDDIIKAKEAPADAAASGVPGGLPGIPGSTGNAVQDAINAAKQKLSDALPPGALEAAAKEAETAKEVEATAPDPATDATTEDAAPVQQPAATEESPAPTEKDTSATPPVEESTPATPAPAETAPAKETPAEPAPAETTPVETTPTESTPAETPAEPATPAPQPTEGAPAETPTTPTE